MARIVGVLLAAGRGERFGGDKLRAALDGGDSVGVTACRALVAALPDTVAIVRRGDDGLAAELEAAGARPIECADAAHGMGHSIACAIGATPDAGGWVIALGDMPWIRPSTFNAVAQALRDGAQVAVATFAGQRGHPVGFAALHGAALRSLQDDRGARDLVAAAQHDATLCRVEVDDDGVLRDVDAPQDLERRAIIPS